MLRKYYRIALFLCLLFLLAGCGSARFTSTLKPGNNPQLAVGDTPFHLASFVAKSGSNKEMSQNWVQPFNAAVPKRALELYPRVFSADWGAVPLVVEAVGDYEFGSIGAMLTGFTLGVLPFPNTNTVDFRVVTSLVDERGDKVPIAPVSFHREDVLWLTLVGPLGCIPIFGATDVPRSTMFLFANMDDLGVKSTQLTTDALVEAVVSGVSKVDAAQLSAIAKARQARLREVAVEGTTYWTFLAPVFSKGIAVQERADRFAALFYRERPRRDLEPVESVIVAQRGNDGRWQPVPAYLKRISKGLVSVSALLENGAPGRVVATEVSEPPLEDFISLPTTTASDLEMIETMRWSNRVLVQAKNLTLPTLLKVKSTRELLDLVSQVENAFLDLNRMGELAKDRAQKAVADGADGGPARELSLSCRERGEILKPILLALKQEVAGRSGK